MSLSDSRPLILRSPELNVPAEVDLADEVLTTTADKRYMVSQWRLIGRRFVRNKAALIGGTVIFLFYLMALFANFLAPYSADDGTQFLFAPPQGIHLLHDGTVQPYVYGIKVTIRPSDLRKIYTVDTSKVVPIHFFVHGDSYQLLGIIPTDVHLFGTDAPNTPVLLLGSDRQGRDMLSRIVIGSQISLTVGLLGVFLSLVFGTIIGVASGYYGGLFDDVVQRVIELIRSFPTIPLWMGLSAALPPHWPPLLTYFGITIILSFIGWTWLARQLRGKVLALRQEEYIVASELAGANSLWIIFRHLIPATLSHIIVIATLALPNMILAETALSFLGLGIRPPLTSWGVLLQEAQNVETLANYPWLLSPLFFIAVAVLAFNFLGDGLRDASDPYSVS
jgi:peptide/nickel transport system permease protein